MRAVAGIDPGKTGGVAVFVDNKLRWAEPLQFDRPGRLYDTLTKYEVEAVIIERAQAAKGQANQFEYGRGFGRTEAAAMMSGAEVRYVAPQWWKARLNVPVDKREAYHLACQLFPTLYFLAPPGPQGGLDLVHGVAEAALIGSILCDDRLSAESDKNNDARLRKAERRRSKPKFTWRG